MTKMKKFSIDEFSEKKREPLLDYKVYEYNFDEMVEGFTIVRESRSLPSVEGEPASYYDDAAQLQQRAWDSLVFLTNCYSGGHPVDELAQIYPTIVSYWESYAVEWRVFQESEQSTSGTVAALSLIDTSFAYANQLICFAILFGWADLINKILPIIDYNNPRKDGMLERLIAPYTKNRDDFPDDCTRHLPYFKTLKIFQAPVEARAELMKDYLEDWYPASRREPYYDSHKRGDQFSGYWAWEAAAITYILKIEDKSYRDAKFYPKDLVEFATVINATPQEKLRLSDLELRAKSGQGCPQAGIWETLDIPLQRRNFEVGEIMQADNASYGITVWRYIGA